MTASATTAYLKAIERLANRNGSYDWLHRHLSHQPDFFRSTLHPIHVSRRSDGDTRVLIADFDAKESHPVVVTDSTDPSQVAKGIESRRSHTVGRLVLLSSTSGITQERLQAQMQPRHRGPRSNPPTLTCSRMAGQPAAHPIKDHVSRLPSTELLVCVAGQLRAGPDILLRFLDQTKHLTYQSHTTKYEEEQATPFEHWRHLQLCFDQGNNVVVGIQQEDADIPWTILILVSEDNCLGVDMNEETASHFQPLLASSTTPSQAFIKKLSNMSRGEFFSIMDNPLSLIPMYSACLIAAIAAHIELCQRSWTLVYEPYANTSVVYGYSYHRDAVRQLARWYSLHLRYIRHTVADLKRFSAYTSSPLGDIEIFDPLIHDFEHFAEEIGSLKQSCDQFLEQQVSKLALQDARTQMREARDLKRISYLAFIFVPLSLTSSFFGMNVKELNSGPTPVWVFVVTAIAILIGSLSVVWLSSTPLLRIISKGMMSCFHGIRIGLSPTPKSAAMQQLAHDPPSTATVSKPKPKPKPKRKGPLLWRFHVWRLRRLGVDLSDESFEVDNYEPYSLPPSHPYAQPLHPAQSWRPSPQSPSGVVQRLTHDLPGEVSLPPPNWAPIPTTYADPYEPLDQEQEILLHSERLPRPPSVYADPPA